jgi:hypothetical protein
LRWDDTACHAGAQGEEQCKLQSANCKYQIEFITAFEFDICNLHFAFSARQTAIAMGTRPKKSASGDDHRRRLACEREISP